MRRGRRPRWLPDRVGERRILGDALRRFRPPDEPPEEPYAYVTAPKRPKLPHLSGSEKKKLDED